jgi:hypothetical protein
MNNNSNTAVSAPEALNTIAEIKSFLKSTTEVPVEPYQFVVLGLFFYIYPLFDALLNVVRGSYHAYLAMSDIWAYERFMSWTSTYGLSDSQFYVGQFSIEALYSVLLFYVMHLVARKFFGSKVILSPLARKVQAAINGIVLAGFLGGYAIAYNGTLNHILPMLVIGCGICFFILGQFTRPLIRYLGVALGTIGLVVLLSFGSLYSFTYNIMYFLTSSVLLGTGLLMIIENRITGRTV